MSQVADKRSPEPIHPAEAAALASLLLALAIALFYPESFILPQPEIAGFRVVPLTWVAPVVALVATACLFLRREFLRFGWVDAALLLFNAYVIARAAYAGVEFAGAVKYAMLGTGVFYLAVIALRDRRLREAFLWSMAVAVLVIAVYGFIEFALQENILYQESVRKIIVDRDDGVHRSGSTLAHPVVYGAMLVQVIPLFAMMSLHAGSRYGRMIGAAATMAAIIAVILTFSKGSWIAAGLYGAALLLALLYRRPAGGLKIIAGAAIFTAVAVIVFWRQVYQETLVRSEESALVRLATWQGAVEAIRERPWLGYGFKQGSLKLETMDVGRKYFEMTSRPIPVDNNYLNLLLDQGVVGFVLWFVFLAAVGIAALRKLTGGRHGDYWLAAALASMVGLAVTAVTFEAWVLWPTYLLFMVVAGSIRGAGEDVVHEG